MATTATATTATTATSLETIVKEAQDAFIAAKSDGKLEVGEVIQIALQVAQKLQRYGEAAALAGSEKAALVRLTLQKGLRAAGGLPVLAGATPEMVASVEAQLLSAAGAAVDAAIAAAHGKFGAFQAAATLHPLLSCLCSGVAAVKAALPPSLVAAAVAKVPKDLPLLQEALALAGVSSSPSNPVLTTVAVAAPATDTAPSTQPETAPSPQALDAKSPAPQAAAEEIVVSVVTKVVETQEATVVAAPAATRD
jgi:hypothetical protein